MDSVVFPGGARLGSITECKTQSRNGSFEGSPHFASSHARSRYSTDGQMSKYPLWCGWTVLPGRAVKSGSSLRRQFTLVTTPVALIWRTCARNSGSSASAATSFAKVVFTSTFARIARAITRFPPASSTPIARPSFVRIRWTAAPVWMVAPWCSAPFASAWEMPPMPPFEDHRLDEFHDLGPERHVLGIGLGVFLREAREFLVVPCGVVPQEDRITVRKREEELRVEGMDLVAEAREVEVPDDLRPQQARGIREPRELDSGEDLLRNAGPSHDRSPFENEDFQAGLRQVRRGDEAVVAPADDDGVPCRSHGPRSAAHLRIVTGRCEEVASERSAFDHPLPEALKA